MLIKLVVFVAINIVDHDYFNVFILFKASLLTASWREVFYRDAHRDTSLAAFAVGAVNVSAAASKTRFGQLAVYIDVDFGFRIDKYRGGLKVGQVAARVWVRCEEL